MIKKIEIFPNTGFHSYFLPLTVDLEVTDSIRAELVRSGTIPGLSESGSRIVLSQSGLTDSPWFRAAGSRAWLRGKFGPYSINLKDGTRQRVHGLWCAIDTATGSASRGYLFKRKVASELSAEDIAAANINPSGTPYIAFDSQLIDPSETILVDLREAFPQIDAILDSTIDSKDNDLSLAIRWLVGGSNEPMPVSLVVDFGNTRTMVLGLESGGDPLTTPFHQSCKPIYFPRELTDSSEKFEENSAADELIPESWFVLKRPDFDCLPFTDERHMYPEIVTRRKRSGWFSLKTEQEIVEIRKKTPHQFIDMSPAVVGAKARRLLTSEGLSGEGRVFLSSPKRYAWDTDPISTFPGAPNWTMISPGEERPIPLNCELLKFLPKNRASRETRISPAESPPPTEWTGEDQAKRPIKTPTSADFCKADTLIWSALRIIEHAYQQIQSEAWRSRRQSGIARVLEEIVVTYPPGWTLTERKNYEAAWTYARNIFYWSRFYGANQGVPQPPRIAVQLDEAIATQLPIIYSEITQLGGRGKDWIELYGRLRGAERTVRVLTIDIGGGTTDTSIVEYRDTAATPNGFCLEPRVIFTDSLAEAGDALMKVIIEKVFLPTVGAQLRAEDRGTFDRVWNDKPLDPGGEFERSVIVRLVIIPIVIRWLQDLQSKQFVNPRTQLPWAPQDCGAEETQINLFNEILRRHGLPGLLPSREPLMVDYKRLNSVICDWVAYLAQIHSRYFAIFQCDLVIVGGKPSEMPEVRHVFESVIPIQRDRLIFTKGYYAGDWLPTNGRNVIDDAKSVTAIGAALYLAMVKNRVPNAQIKPLESRTEVIRNYWGVLSSNSAYMAKDDILLDPKRNVFKGMLSLYQVIGRQRLPHTRPEPVYQFRWKPGTRRSKGQGQISVVIERQWESDENQKYVGSESLILKEVSGEIDGEQVTIDDVELHLRTLREDSYWLDSPRFEIHWPD